MIERHKRRSLPARLHVRGTKIVDNGDTSHTREQSAVTYLPSPTHFWPVQNGLAMKANQRDILGSQTDALE